MKKLTALALALVLACTPLSFAAASEKTSAAANDLKVNDVQVIRDERLMIGTNEMEFSEAKQSVAEAYYNAKKSGNTALASAILTADDDATTIADFLAIADMAENIMEQNTASVSLNNSALFSSAYYGTVNVTQFPQETNKWCGFAALQTILKHMGSSSTIKAYSQTTIKSKTAPNTNSLPWFDGSNAQADNVNYYPAAVFLKANTNYSYWTFRSHYFSGHITNNATVSTITYSIDSNRPVMVCGTSTKNNKIHANYPDTDVHHWVVAYGYVEPEPTLGTYISICDPASGGAGVSFGSKVPAYFSTTETVLTNYAKNVGGYIY